MRLSVVYIDKRYNELGNKKNIRGGLCVGKEVRNPSQIFKIVMAY